MKLQHLANAMLEAKSAKLPDEENFYYGKSHGNKNNLNKQINIGSPVDTSKPTSLTPDEIELAIKIFQQLKVKFFGK
jgi:hypothetical protein